MEDIISRRMMSIAGRPRPPSVRPLDVPAARTAGHSGRARRSQGRPIRRSRAVAVTARLAQYSLGRNSTVSVPSC